MRRLWMVWILFFAIFFQLLAPGKIFSQEKNEEKSTLFSFKIPFAFVNEKERVEFAKECEENPCKVSIIRKLSAQKENTINGIIIGAALSAVRFFCENKNCNDLKLDEIKIASDDGKVVLILVDGLVGNSEERIKLLSYDLIWSLIVLEKALGEITEKLTSWNFEKFQIKEIIISEKEIALKVRAFPSEAGNGEIKM